MKLHEAWSKYQRLRSTAHFSPQKGARASRLSHASFGKVRALQVELCLASEHVGIESQQLKHGLQTELLLFGKWDLQSVKSCRTQGIPLVKSCSF
jgi:hypothetical protein